MFISNTLGGEAVIRGGYEIRFGAESFVISRAGHELVCRRYPGLQRDKAPVPARRLLLNEALAWLDELRSRM
jgi:hypothetical protein